MVQMEQVLQVDHLVNQVDPRYLETLVPKELKAQQVQMEQVLRVDL